MQKLIVPVAAVVLALMAGLALWFLMRSPDAHPTPVANTAENTPAPAPRNRPDEPAPAKFDPAQVKPDPVVTDRPNQAYEIPENNARLIVSGRVVTDDGSGVADAHVVFMGERRIRDFHASGYTDTTGFYQLLAWSPVPPPRVSPGRTCIVAAETPDGGVAVSDSIKFPEGPSAEMPDLVVKTGGVIEGQVLTADGKPVPGAEVSARSSGPVLVPTLRGRRPAVQRRQYVTSITADAAGRFKLSGLPASSYGMDARGGYFGDTLGRQQVDLRGTHYAWQELRLPDQPMIRGVLTDGDGTPVPGAVVLLNLEGTKGGLPIQPDFRRDDADGRNNLRHFRNDNFRNRRQVTDALGRFGFTRPGAAEFTLQARVGEAEAKLEHVKAGPDDYHLQIDLKTAVSGTVRDADTGRVIEQFDVRVLRGAGTEEPSPFRQVADNGRFDLHPGGAFLLPNPTPGSMKLQVSAAGYAPALVGVDNLNENERRDGVQIELVPTCTVSARLVRDGRPLTLEPCALLFDDRLAYAASSDELGRLRIRGVVPATYKLVVALQDGTKLEGEVTIPPRHEASLDFVVGSPK